MKLAAVCSSAKGFQVESVTVNERDLSGLLFFFNHRLSGSFLIAPK